MSKITLPFFGEIDKKDEKVYDVGVEINGNTIDVDLNLDDGLPDEEWFEKCPRFLKNVEKYETQILGLIKGSYLERNTIKDYFDFHKEELLDELLEGTDSTLSVDERLLSKIHLERIGLYCYEIFAVWDFTFDNSLSNYILSIATNENCEIIDITMES